jgi:inhibitor of cysteine peptidase
MLRQIMIAMVWVLCACGNSSSSGRSIMVLTEADAGRSIELPVGDKLKVSLPGSPTTGFRWEVNVGDDTILKPGGEPEFEPSSKAIGGGGREVFSFDVASPGRMRLKLIYRRPFEKDISNAKTFEVAVTVR